MKSHAIQGGKVSAVNTFNSRCAEALAQHTFKSSDFLKGSDFAANRPLGFILNVLSSNDPEAWAQSIATCGRLLMMSLTA